MHQNYYIFHPCWYGYALAAICFQDGIPRNTRNHNNSSSSSPEHTLHSRPLDHISTPWETTTSYLLLADPLFDQADGGTKLSLVLGKKRHLGRSVRRLGQLQLTPGTKTPQLPDGLPSDPDEGGDSLRGYGNLGRQALSDLFYCREGGCMKFRKAADNHQKREGTGGGEGWATPPGGR